MKIYLSIAIIFAVGFLLFLSACSSPVQSQPRSSSLAGSEWGTQIPNQFIQFKANGYVSGNGGCNEFGAEYQQSKNTLNINTMRSTEMACQSLSDEHTFFTALENVSHYEMTHKTLLLKDARGQILATLQRRDWD